MKKLSACLMMTSLLLAGCASFPGGGASVPTHFYRLETPSVKAPTSVSALNLLIKVRASDELKTPMLVLADSDYELEYQDTDRWADPVSSEVGRVLANVLRPAFAHVEAVPVPSDYVYDYRVEVIIDKLWGTSHGDVVLEARWVITNAKGEEVATGSKSFKSKEWTVGDYQDFAKKASGLVEKLADEIRDSVSQIKK